MRLAQGHYSALLVDGSADRTDRQQAAFEQLIGQPLPKSEDVEGHGLVASEGRLRTVPRRLLWGAGSSAGGSASLGRIVQSAGSASLVTTCRAPQPATQCLRTHTAVPAREPDDRRSLTDTSNGAAAPSSQSGAWC